MVKFWVQIAGLVIVAVLGTSVFVAWRAVRREQTQLQEKLKNAEQALQAANARQESRNAELEQQLGKIQHEKNVVQKPAEVVKALPDVLPLPKPLVLEQKAQVPASGQPVGQEKPEAPVSKVELPSEDLKPLYDFALGCKACQEELAAAQADLKDEKTKTEALGRERDQALRAARGGSVLARVARAAKWFVVGAAAGAVAGKMTR
jgi:type II secretory pathway pseudopilin PulG